MLFLEVSEDPSGLESNKIILNRVYKPFQGSCMVLAATFEFDETILKLFSNRLFSTPNEFFLMKQWDSSRSFYSLNSGINLID